MQGRLAWTIEHTPFSFPVFVIWKVTDGIKKGRVVVDIRPLSKVSEKDSYTMPVANLCSFLVPQ